MSLTFNPHDHAAEQHAAELISIQNTAESRVRGKMRHIDDLSDAELATLACVLGQQVQEAAARLDIERPEFILAVLRRYDAKVVGTCERYAAPRLMREVAKNLEAQLADDNGPWQEILNNA